MVTTVNQSVPIFQSILNQMRGCRGRGRRGGRGRPRGEGRDDGEGARKPPEERGTAHTGRQRGAGAITTGSNQFGSEAVHWKLLQSVRSENWISGGGGRGEGRSDGEGAVSATQSKRGEARENMEIRRIYYIN